MTATKLFAPETLQPASLQEILGLPGPCLTLFLPPYRPGELASTPAALLKAGLQHAGQELAERRCPETDRAELFAPLEELAQDPELLEGSGRGRAIFRSPELLRQFHMIQPVPASVVVAGSFAVRPLLAELQLPRVFYILALSKDHVQLMRCEDFRAKAVGLPPGFPLSLEEAMAFEPPDHDLENRSAAGSSTGAMRRVRFGTGSGRETQHAHLSDFYKLVDRGIHQILPKGDVPLVLAGVAEETDAYRAISGYRNLSAGTLQGSPDFASQEPEFLMQAYSLLRAEATVRELEALTEAIERAAPSHVSTDPDEVLRAAFEGRVRQLYIDESANRTGVFERGRYRTCGREDLLNLAAVQTILHRGGAFGLPHGMMPPGLSAAAILRF